MTWEDIKVVENEMLRVRQRIEDLNRTRPADQRKGSVWSSKESGALRRASMDLTRSLAQMRRW